LKRLISVDPVPLRRAKYEDRDGSFNKAVEQMAIALIKQGIDVGDLMVAELQERAKIRDHNKKAKT
jgi:hypothetical protein